MLAADFADVINPTNIRMRNLASQLDFLVKVFESLGIKLFVDPISIQYLKNAEVDFVDTVTGGGFTIKNPNAKSTCGCGSSFSTE